MDKYSTQNGVIQYVREVTNETVPDDILVSVLFEDKGEEIVFLRNYGWLSSYVSKEEVRKVDSTDDLRDELFGEKVKGVFEDEDLKCFVEEGSKRAEYFEDYQNGSEQSSTTP